MQAAVHITCQTAPGIRIVSVEPVQKERLPTIEQIQRRATKLVPSLKGVEYDERLRRLRLTTLEQRRARGDLIEFYKYTNELNLINLLLQPQPAHSRNNDGPASGRICKQFTKVTQRDMFFSNRVVDQWNALPNDVVTAKSLNIFQNKLDNYYKIRTTRTHSFHSESNSLHRLTG